MLGNLTHNTGRALLDGAGDHGRCCGSYLTGVQVKKSVSDIKASVSMDQLSPIRSASRRGLRRSKSGSKTGARRATAIPAIRAPTRTIWRGGARRSRCRRFSIRARSSSGCSATARSSRPRRARSGGINRRSILDFITEDTRALHGSLGPTDQRKLDEYLSSIRQIEEQLKRAEQENAQVDPGMEKPYGVPSDFAEHFRLMTDMITVAFQADLTRVVTFLVTREGTSRAYREIGIPDGHHPLTHHRNIVGADGQGCEDQPLPHGAVLEVGRRS